jgi:phage terminase large subunit
MMRRVSTGYRPRPLQAEIHRNLARFNVLVCHRRFGKTVLCINELIDRALSCPLERPRYAYIAPLYRQAKQAAWDYLKVYTAALPGARANESELRVDLPNGARMQLFGADNPDALRGIYLDGVVLDEFGQMNPRVWTEVLRPALTDREGWAVFIGTPRGRNAFHAIYQHAQSRPDWHAALYKASETAILPAAELRAARADMAEEEYDQEFECSFQAAIAGAYYGKLMSAAQAEGRIGRAPWNPALPVDTAWDLGIGDSTAIWFVQQAAREIHWIDFYEASGVGLDHYAKVLGDKPYVWGEHLLPHDAAARELGTGKTRVETLAALGIRVRVVGLHAVDDGINAVRNLLPRSWFDAEKCAAGLEALKNYRREWDDRLGAFRPRPLHDWSSHAADAARTAAMGLRPEKSTRRLPATAEGGYEVFRY